MHSQTLPILCSIAHIVHYYSGQANLQMILKTDRVVVGHVRQLVLHKFLMHHNGWAVQFITLVDHVIEKGGDQIAANTIIPVPLGHNSQEIEVRGRMLFKEQ